MPSGYVGNLDLASGPDHTARVVLVGSGYTSGLDQNEEEGLSRAFARLTRNLTRAAESGVQFQFDSPATKFEEPVLAAQVDNVFPFEEV